MSILQAHLPSPRYYCERGSRKNVRTRGGGQLHGNRTFQTQPATCTHELTAVVTAHTRLLQTQARLNPSMEMGAVHEVPALTEELLTGVNCGERESQFSLRVEPCQIDLSLVDKF